MSDRLYPDYPGMGVRLPVKSVFRVVLADGTILEFPLLGDEPMEERMTRFVGFFEELYAVPGVQGVFDKYGVVVAKE